MTLVNRISLAVAGSGTAAVLAFLVLGATPRQGAAQPAGVCYTCENGCGEWSTSHTTPPTDAGQNGIAAPHFWCMDTGNPCSISHPGCIGSQLANESKEAIALAANWESIDEARAKELLERHSSVVHLSPDGTAIQIEGCVHGAVVARLPIVSTAAQLGTVAPRSVNANG